MVFREVCHGNLKVPRVGEAETAQRPQLRELEVTLIKLEDIAPHGTMRQRDVVTDSSWDDTDLIGAHKQTAQFGADVQHPVLQHDEKVAVGRIERLVLVHALSCCENEYSYTLLHRRIPRTRNEFQPVYPVHRLIEVKRIPPELIGDLVELAALRVGVIGRRFAGLEGGM